MAESKKPKLVGGTSPIGIAKYPRLNQPDTKFKAAGEYSVKLILSAEDAAPLKEAIEAEAEKAVEATRADLEQKLVDAKGATKPKLKAALDKLEAGDLPIQPEYDDDGEETGNLVINFKTNASYTDKKTGKTIHKEVSMFDAKGHKLEGKKRPSIWGGSKLSVAYQLVPYYNAATNKAGVSVRISAVQIIELVSGSGGNAASYGFGTHDGYEAPEEAEGGDSPFGDQTGGAGGDEEDEDF